jgi:hypothetical protein
MCDIMRVKRLFTIAASLALLAAFGARVEAAHDARAGASRFDGASRADAGQRRVKSHGRARRKKIVREKEGDVAEGLWGGAHVRLNVREDGAGLEFDCARGEISAPFKTDAEGRFDLPGTFTRQSPGPIRIGITPSAQPARYSGRVEGETMTLSLKLTGTDKALDTYTLTRGSEGRLRKCR